MDTQFNDAVGGFDLCMTRDGQGAATSVIPFAAGITLSGGTTFDHYQQGTYTPTDGSGAGLSFTVLRASYVRIGSLYFCDLTLVYPSTSDGSNAAISGLPASFANVSGVGGMFMVYRGPSGTTLQALPTQNTASFTLVNQSATAVFNSSLSGATIRAQFFIPTV